VRSEAELDGFYEWWRTIFAALAERGIRPSCVRDIIESAELAPDARAS